MKWRVRLAVGLLILATCTGVFVQHCIEDFCDEVCENLRETGIDVQFQTAKKQWEEKATILSVWIRHDRVDHITESFARAEAFFESDTEDEFRAEVAQIISKIQLLKQYDRPDLRSIF